MKQIIPFIKDLNFNTKISEVTSISLEQDLKLENHDSIVGNFIITGKYKMNEISINEEAIDCKIPFDITLDNKYDANGLSIDIDNFYYEIINDEILRVHIDVLLDNLNYLKEFKEKEERGIDGNEEVENENERNDDMVDITLEHEKDNKDEIKEENTNDNNEVIEEKKIEPRDTNKNMVNDLEGNFLSEKESFVTYKVHIVRNSENISDITSKYNVSKEELEKYNDLTNIVIGSKIIIPCDNE